MENEPKARNVFISFRSSDGMKYKKELCDLFKGKDDVIDYSEDKDRSGMSDTTIKLYLYKKLARSSVTIILLTNDALEYEKKDGKINDWIYDEVRYSLQDRDENRTNGIIAVYVDEVKDKLYSEQDHKCSNCDGYKYICLKSIHNLFRDNMLNVKAPYKKCKCDGIYDHMYDSYCSLVHIDEFKNNLSYYIDVAEEKRNMLDHYELTKEYKGE